MRLGKSLAKPGWLGPFDQMTLMKGPGYPFFLAVSHWTGLPVTVTTAFLQIVASACAGWAVLRLTGMRVAAVAVCIFLIFNPVIYTIEFDRVVRDQIYWVQTVIVFSLFSIMLLSPPNSNRARLAIGGVAGFVLGWAWLTREEGVWFIPGLSVLLLGFLVLHLGRRKDKKKLLNDNGNLRNTATALMVACLTFVAFNVAVMTANLVAYGSFIAVDFKEKNFQAALNALQSVEVGERIPHVPVSLAAREKIAEVSPTFRPIEKLLSPGGALSTWQDHGCAVYPETCGEIAGGWFMWGVRDAVDAVGGYESPAKASETFRAIADEVESACRDGRLTCEPRLVGLMPAMTSDQWKIDFPRSVLTVLGRTVFTEAQSQGKTPLPYPEQNPTSSFYLFWALVNYPVSTEPPEKLGATVVEGWFYDSQPSEWPTLTVRSEKGNSVQTSVQRLSSLDLVSHFGESAKENRFTIAFKCPDICTVSADRDNLPSISLSVRDMKARHIKEGTATLTFDVIFIPVRGQVSPHDKRSLLAGSIRSEVLEVQKILTPFLILAGALAMLGASGLALWRRMLPISLVAAMAAWIFVATRVLLLALIDVSAFPGIGYIYVAPGTCMAIIAAILSIASCFILRHRPGLDR